MCVHVCCYARLIFIQQRTTNTSLDGTNFEGTTRFCRRVTFNLFIIEFSLIGKNVCNYADDNTLHTSDIKSRWIHVRRSNEENKLSVD